jgi:hypothetical protein
LPNPSEIHGSVQNDDATPKLTLEEPPRFK